MNLNNFSVGFFSSDFRNIIMGKFASAKKSPRVSVAASQTSDDAKSKPSSILKKAPFKAKIAKKTAIIIPKYAVPEKIKPINAAPETEKNQIEAVTITKPTETTATANYRHIPKKEKIQNRHNKLMSKFNTALETRRAVQMKAKSAKTARKQKQKLEKVSKPIEQGVRSAMADLASLKSALPSLDDALPSLNTLFRLKSKDLKTGVPKFDARAKKAAARAAAKESGEPVEPRKLSKTTKTLNKKNEFMQRYNYFQKLSADKMFKTNPRAVIAAHIRNRQADQS